MISEHPMPFEDGQILMTISFLHNSDPTTAESGNSEKIPLLGADDTSYFEKTAAKQ